MDPHEAMKVVKALNDIKKVIKELSFWIAIGALWISIAILLGIVFGG